MSLEEEEEGLEKMMAKIEEHKDSIGVMKEEDLLSETTEAQIAEGEDTEDITILIKMTIPTTVVVSRWVLKNYFMKNYLVFFLNLH
jgi:hypothetical protein